MKIKSFDLYDIITNSIIEYNNQFYDTKDENLKLPVFEEDEDIPQEVLAKLDKLTINYNTTYQSPEEIEEFNKELTSILSSLHLKTFSFTILNSRNKKAPNDYDLSFLDVLNQDVEYLTLSRVDLSKLDTDYLKRFPSIKAFISAHSNITPELLDKLPDTCLLDLKGNTIMPQDYGKYIELIQKHNGKVDLSDRNLNIYGDLLKNKSISYINFVRIKDLVDIPLDNFTIDMNVKLSGLDREDLEQIASIISEYSNATLKISPEDLQRLEQVKPITNKLYIRARRISEVTTDFINSHPNTEKYELDAPDLDNGRNVYNTYTKDEILAVRKEVDSILAQIQVPPEGTPNREKIIFAQVYSKLGEKMEYDYEAIKKENEKDEQMQKTCRDLYGGLVNGKCVCAGYANILANVLSCFDMKAKYIGGSINIEDGVVYNLKDPQGHAWNEVYLDGESFLTDLTWDYNNIRAGHFPLKYFLKSKADFGHNDYAFSVEEGECKQSLPVKEQLDLFRQIGYDIPEPEVKDEQTQDNISVLSSLVIASAEQIPSSSIRIAANKIEKGLSILVRKESEIDGRDDEDGRY